MRISDWSSDVCSSDLRDPKLDVEDREALKQSWVDRAAALGFDGKGLVAAAEARAGIAQPDSALERGYCAIVEAIDGARNRVGALLRPHDPLVAQIGRAHVCTPVTNAHLDCRLLLDKKQTQ